MNEEEIILTLRQIFRDLFILDEDTANALGTEAEPKRIQAWDSAGHLGLILELEDKFDLSVPDDMVPNLGHFRNIVKFILLKKKSDLKQ